MADWSLIRTVAPTVEPVTLGEIMAHLRVDDSEEETLIVGYIAAAREWAEQYTRRAFMTQTWRLRMRTWPEGDIIALPRPPLATVTSVAYKDGDGASQTWASSNYLVGADHEPGVISKAVGSEWPGLHDQIDAVTITYVAGATTTAAVPAPIKAAVRLLTKEMFDVRGETIEGSRSGNVMAAQSLLAPYRVHWL